MGPTEIQKKLETVDANLSKLVNALEEIVDAMNMKTENASEKWLESERGEAYQDAVYEVEQLKDELDAIVLPDIYWGD